ncbi:hypothetical protein J5N97_002653 [Dioscorea zingiberensis]|uniref:Uncharacterized protein n=1 Tax=Dioscorea zingiberensis TaxID=325984 RepID=A0A9D5D4P6_9LILI|nr:hypothetical protein J5N97_002653 [Dioscorea zingiberensis]
MASSRDQKELEPELHRISKRLASPPSDIEALIDLIDEADMLLTEVDQLPSDSMACALYPVMKALIRKELLRHSDTDVRMTVGSCFSEISRITAPTSPYNNGLMKKIFRIIVDGIGGLNDTSSRSYYKRVYMLHVLAKYKLCLLLLDLECHELILEMFHHFLNTISANDNENIFSAMETVMTLVVLEIEIISPELLDCLLACVKRDNKDLSPVACKLGEKVIANCTRTLKPYLVEKVQSMGLPLGDYCKIVADMCQDNFVDPKQSKLTGADKCLGDTTTLSERTHSVELPQASGISGFEGQLEEVYSADGIPPKSKKRGKHDILDSTGGGSRRDESRKVVSCDDLHGEIYPKRSLSGSQFARKRGGEILTADHHASSFGGKGSLIPIQNEEEARLSVGLSSKRSVKTTDDSKGKLHMHSGRKKFDEPQHMTGIDESLVGCKIRVWWPDDNMFYEGMVSSFDPVSRKHKVVYYDDDVEILSLKKERWEFVKNTREKAAGAKNMPSLDASLDRPLKKMKLSSNPARSLVNPVAQPGSGDISAHKPEANKMESISTSHGLDGKKHKSRRIRGPTIISSSDDEPNNTSSNSGVLHVRKHKHSASKLNKEHTVSGTSENVGLKLIRTQIKSKGEHPKTGGSDMGGCIPKAGSKVMDHTLIISSNLKNEIHEIHRKPKNDAPKKSTDTTHNAVDTSYKPKRESANAETSKAAKQPTCSKAVEINVNYLTGSSPSRRN